MAAPFIVIRTFTVKQGKLDGFRQSLPEPLGGKGHSSERKARARGRVHPPRRNGGLTRDSKVETADRDSPRV